MLIFLSDRPHLPAFGPFPCQNITEDQRPSGSILSKFAKQLASGPSIFLNASLRASRIPCFARADRILRKINDLATCFPAEVLSN